MSTTIVFKIGTSSLTHEDGSLSVEKIQNITRQIALLHKEGVRLIIVSSGAVAAGFKQLGFQKRPSKIAEKQACAAVGQGLLMEEYTMNLLKEGVVSAQLLLTQDDFADNRRYKNAYQALSVLLQRRAIPIINENDTVAVQELKVGDNDTLSAQVAAMVQADLLVLLTDVDGLYTANPSQDPQAKQIATVEKITPELVLMAGAASSKNATGGMYTKLKAAHLATSSGVPVYICSSLKKDALLKAANGFDHGTLFTANQTSMKNRKQWMAFYAKSNGAIYIDQGAADALRQQGKSLLLSGIQKVSGHFKMNDIVSVYLTNGEQVEDKELVGKGKVAFSRSVLEELISQKVKSNPIIHRDNWISLDPQLEALWVQDLD
ncbi:glutamate 5-kinase [Granulicatella seriolae]|uniref:Glutamate 5-kinase n=1 Tax=Granulicatella seriolae TaxID=2967226 RepID=A0ABT1WL78_9LACT|nr:glutamate 5-kinase [Granulicatella seriolae]